MIDTMKELLRTNDMCVLATTAAQRPHCSLMAYVCDDAVHYLYMVTFRDSVKFRNLSQNPDVSLLVDTRETHGKGRRAETKALTAAGIYEPIASPVQRAEAKSRLMAGHPHLEVFLQSDAAEIIAVRLTSLLLMDGLTDATFHEIA
ncbi:MAG: pyridoxamine 5'-phosphate oxidase family protein [Desulfatiglandaceae bacterium]